MTYAPPSSNLNETSVDESPRRPFVAFILSWFAPGLGHAYVGRLGLGFILAGFFLLAGPAFLLLAVAGGVARYDVLWPGLAVLLLLWVAQIAWAVVLALGAQEYRPKRYNRRLVYTLWFAGYLVLGYGIPMGLRATVLESFKVPSGSMLPTLLIGDQLFVVKPVEVSHGDVIVFTSPTPDPVDFAKRAVALGGERFEIRHGQFIRDGVPFEMTDLGAATYDGKSEDGRWYRFTVRRHLVHDGQRSWEVLLDREVLPANFGPVDVPAGHVFVLGDNVEHSWDSRAYGSVPLENVIGRVDSVWYSEGPNGEREERSGKRIQ